MNYRVAPGVIGKMEISRLEATKEMILRAVCREYEVTIPQLTAKSRKRKVVEPRHVACYLLRKYAHWVWEEIGTEFNRDHTTAMNAYRAVQDRMDTEPEFKARIEKLIPKIFS